MSEERVTLIGEDRSDMGKGASRRLRRLKGQVPAIIYGGKTGVQTISLAHHKVLRALEEESFYSSVFIVDLGNKKEHVILKDMQRHPYKKQILHMDLQRVTATESITKTVPLHYLHEEECKGVKAGGVIARSMSEVEIKCQAQNLPSYIEVDLLDLDMDQTLHLSDISLPKDVELTTDITDSSHDLPIVSVHPPRKEEEEEEVVEEAAEAPEGEASADTESKD